MQFTDLPQNTSGVLYQNDSPTPLLVTVQVAGSFSTRARAHPVIFNSTANPADQAVAVDWEHSLKDLSDCSGTGVQVNAPNGGQIGFDVLIAPPA